MNLAVWQFLLMPISRVGRLLVQLLNGQEEGHFTAPVEFGQSQKTTYIRNTAPKAKERVHELPTSNKREKSVQFITIGKDAPITGHEDPEGE